MVLTSLPLSSPLYLFLATISLAPSSSMVLAAGQALAPNATSVISSLQVPQLSDM